MIRFELIANGSVQDDVIEGLEATLPGFFYTVIPLAHGRGRQQRRLGTATWPEENFILIAYVDDAAAGTIRETIASIKARFPTEGIKLFELKALM